MQFLDIMSNTNLFGMFYKIMYLVILVGVENRNPKSMESMIHDEVGHDNKKSSHRIIVYINVIICSG